MEPKRGYFSEIQKRDHGGSVFWLGEDGQEKEITGTGPPAPKFPDTVDVGPVVRWIRGNIKRTPFIWTPKRATLPVSG